MHENQKSHSYNRDEKESGTHHVNHQSNNQTYWGYKTRKSYEKTRASEMDVKNHYCQQSKSYDKKCPENARSRCHDEHILGEDNVDAQP